MFLTSPIPCTALKRLEFLLGNYNGTQMMYPPDQSVIRSEVHTETVWETSDRYMRVEIFSRASTSVYDSMLGMIGYDADQAQYRMWIFARSQAEPMYLTGDFVDGSLILVSEPSTMLWGVKKLRYSLTPIGEDEFDMVGEYWTLEGWQRYCNSRMQRESQ
jgi:hypothetical protein